MERNSTLTHQIVMRRVRAIHRLRPLVSNAVVAFVLLGVSLYVLGREVFVAQVFRNFATVSGVPAAFEFIQAAFFNTTVIVQTFLILTCLAGFYFTREIVRLLAQPTHRYA